MENNKAHFPQYTEKDAEAIVRANHADFKPYAVHTETVENGRWHVRKFAVYQRESDRTFWGVLWGAAATEYQEDKFDGKPCQVEPRTVTKTEWKDGRPKMENNKMRTHIEPGVGETAMTALAARIEEEQQALAAALDPPSCEPRDERRCIVLEKHVPQSACFEPGAALKSYEETEVAHGGVARCIPEITVFTVRGVTYRAVLTGKTATATGKVRPAYCLEKALKKDVLGNEAWYAAARESHFSHSLLFAAIHACKHGDG